jgi:hypothetical protein
MCSSATGREGLGEALRQFAQRPCSRLPRQYLYFCTSKASKLSTRVGTLGASSGRALKLLVYETLSY